MVGPKAVLKQAYLSILFLLRRFCRTFFIFSAPLVKKKKEVWNDLYLSKRIVIIQKRQLVCAFGACLIRY